MDIERGVTSHGSMHNVEIFLLHSEEITALKNGEALVERKQNVKLLGGK